MTIGAESGREEEQRWREGGGREGDALLLQLLLLLPTHMYLAIYLSMYLCKCVCDECICVAGQGRGAKARASEAKVRESHRGGKKRKILGCLPGPPSRCTGQSTPLPGGPQYTRLIPSGLLRINYRGGTLFTRWSSAHGKGTRLDIWEIYPPTDQGTALLR